MVSCGNDCTVRAWKHLDSYEGFDAYDEAGADSRDLPDCPPAAVQLTVTRTFLVEVTHSEFDTKNPEWSSEILCTCA